MAKSSISLISNLRPQVEIAVQSPADTLVAFANGADRVELATALPQTGGLTPNLPLLQSVIKVAQGPVHVLIRCRPGGFIYTPEEIDLQCQEIELVKQAGAAGVVVGAATPDHKIDLSALTKFKSVSAGLDITLHRVIDICADQIAALQAVGEMGFTRILTSGAATCAADAPLTLKSLVQAAKPYNLEVMAGGGLTTDNLKNLQGLNLNAVHGSLSKVNYLTGVAGPGGKSGNTTCTDGDKVRSFVIAAGQL